MSLGPQSGWSKVRKRAALLSCAFAASPVAAIRAIFWYLRGFRVRARNAIVGIAAAHPGYYRFWTRYVEPGLLKPNEKSGVPIEFIVWHCDGSELADLSELPADLTAKVVDQAATPAALATVLRGLAAGADGSLASVWILPLSIGEKISAAAMPSLAAQITNHPAARLAYWDEDELEGSQRSSPWLKPQWDELVFLAMGGMLGACVVRGDVMLPVLATRESLLGDKDIAEQLIADVVRGLSDKEILHVPRILTHRLVGASRQSETARRVAALSNWIDLEDLIPFDGALHGPAVPRFPLPDPAPLVSIIIPSRDRAELLRTCLAGITATQYPGPIEIIVVDNGSVDRDAIELIARLPNQGVRVLTHTGPFNFSQLNNMAVGAASGEYVCLLNNDIEVVAPDWLSEMMRHATRPGTGAVGALLLYPDRTVQHAGVAVGIGGAAGHVYRNLGMESEGHRWTHRMTRQVSAVTAACMVVRRMHYLQVGGMDEAEFKVAFNDIDLCLKLTRLGLRNVFVAQAVLIHHESKSRGSDALPANRSRFADELAALRKRWNTGNFVDPFHHPLFLYSSEQVVLSP